MGQHKDIKLAHCFHQHQWCPQTPYLKSSKPGKTRMSSAGPALTSTLYVLKGSYRGDLSWAYLFVSKH